MDTLNAYGSDDSDNENTTTTTPIVTPAVQAPDRRFLQAAPAVSLTAGRSTSTALTVSNNDPTTSMMKRKRKNNESSTSMVLMNNPTKEVMYQSVQGPQVMDPALQKNSTKSGITEANVAIDPVNFDQQRTAFQRAGIANAPVEDGNVLAVRTTLGYTRDRLQKMTERHEYLSVASKRPRNAKHEEAANAGSDDEAEYGIWGPPTTEEKFEQEQSLTAIQKGEDLAPEQLAEREYITERNRQKGIEEEEKEEQSAFDRLCERKMAHLLPPTMKGDATAMEPTTTFHGEAEFNYKGLSWMAPPAGLGSIITDGGVTNHKCFVPKKCIHRFTGHNQGVHRIRFFPVTGHLILSAGLDGKCKIWSLQTKQVMRTYIGHSAAVRDVQFNHTGTKFVSASFDRYLRLWDTESGKVLQTFCNRKVPYCIQFYPHDDNFFVVGCSDNKIVTYNATTAEITQEYNHHLAPVNAIVFVEDQGTTKMVTTSDDKKVLVWEWDIGVPIKYISDPSMHSMPCMTLHPTMDFILGQSLDNTIVVFQAGGRFAMQKKKKFSGHITSGYACEMTVSPDGQYLVSGDGSGNVFVWDWKNHKILQKYRAHTGGPAICCAWHPIEKSTMVTCGWDGIIKVWQ